MTAERAAIAQMMGSGAPDCRLSSRPLHDAGVPDGAASRVCLRSLGQVRPRSVAGGQ